MFQWRSSARRIIVSIVVAALAGVLVITILDGFAAEYPLRLFQGIAIGVAAAGLLLLFAAYLITRIGDYHEPADEEAFEVLVRRSERLARENLAAEPTEGEFLELDPYDRADFEELIREDLDDLPDLLIKALDHVTVIVSDQGLRNGA